MGCIVHSLLHLRRLLHSRQHLAQVDEVLGCKVPLQPAKQHASQARGAAPPAARRGPARAWRRRPGGRLVRRGGRNRKSSVGYQSFRANSPAMSAAPLLLDAFHSPGARCRHAGLPLRSTAVRATTCSSSLVMRGLGLLFTIPMALKARSRGERSAGAQAGRVAMSCARRSWLKSSVSGVSVVSSSSWIDRG